MPNPPEDFVPSAPPWLPMLVPIVLSVVMAVVLGSPLALMMGVLGPVMVAGGWWESRRQARRRYQVQAEDYERKLEERAQQVRRLEAKALAESTNSHPSVLQWSTHPVWRGPPLVTPQVRIGQRLWSPPDGHALSGERAVAGMPATVDSSLGLAFVAAPDALDLWRALLVQWSGHTPAGLMPRLDELTTPLPREARGPSRIIWVTSATEVPAECGVVIVHHSGQRAEVHAQESLPWTVTLDTLTQAQALWALRRCTREGDTARAEPRDVARRDQLWMTLSENGPEIDLVAEGPHAIVWGATGSGKSQTVVTLVCSLAKRYTPERLICIVIDFKGGAGLGCLAALPHTVGVTTDISHTPSQRALAGLRSEMLRRERLLAEYGVSEWAALDDGVECPRLVVVVDEVAWLLTNHPQWTEGLEDVLARGRSLGVHVILSTQRLAGVISRAMMANISLRVCGRISDAGELAEWMPDTSPSLVATMRHLPPGQVVLAGALARPVLMEVDSWKPEPSEQVPSGWRVWVDELPEHSPWSEGEWALSEVTETQAHRLVPSPLPRGSLAIIGDLGSGRSATARALGALSPGAVAAPAFAAGLWACMRELAGTATTIVVDDADTLLHQAGPEGEGALLDSLQGYDGPLILVCAPTHRVSRALVRLVPQVLVMGMAKPEDRDLWGTTPRATPGSALWEGTDVQVLYPAPQIHPWRPTYLPVNPDWEALRSDSPPGRWHEIAARSTSVEVCFDGLDHREVRLHSGGRLWIPPLPTPPEFLWVWRAGKPVLANSVDWRR